MCYKYIKLSSYQNDIFDLVSLIPKGRITNYGAIADYLSLGSARMVGWALNKCHLHHTEVPAHRVVNRKGELSGRNYFPDPDYMSCQLIKEGVAVKNNKVVNFDKHFWHPEELEN